MENQEIKKSESVSKLTPILKYLPDNTVYLNLPCILTLTKTLQIGMPYLYHEGHHTFAVRLLHVSDSHGYVNLSIQNLTTGEVNKISWILKNDIKYCLWSLTSLDYLMNLAIKSKESDSAC